MLLLILTIAFACTAFISPPLPENKLNPLYFYYLNTLQYLTDRIALVIILLLVIPILLTFSRKYRPYPLLKKYFLASIHLFVLSFVAYFLSAFLIFLVAVVEVNIFSLLINSNPKIAGIDLNISKINNLGFPPKIILAAGDNKMIPISVATAATGNDNFFGKNVLPSVPGILVMQVRPPSSIFFVDDFMVIAEVEEKSLESVSPRLGYLFVSDYFNQRKINKYPKVSLMDKDDYLEYRKKDAAQKLERMNNVIKEINENLSSFSAVLASGKEEILQDQNLVKESILNRDLEYRRCINQGLTALTCQERRRVFNEELALIENGTREKAAGIAYAEKRLKQYSYYQELFKKQKEAMSISFEYIPYELGVFEPKDKIRMVFDQENENAIADYFHTLTHEYLHYSSFVSDQKKFGSSFFEEGLTEYFTRRVLENVISNAGNAGYPLQEKIVSHMTRAILERELADIYFTKDEESLEVILNQVYGDDFYKSNLFLFEALQFTSDPAQALKIGNDIMEKVNGEVLTEEDLIRTYENIGK